VRRDDLNAVRPGLGGDERAGDDDGDVARLAEVLERLHVCLRLEDAGLG
jgi:hypothetical protein